MKPTRIGDIAFLNLLELRVNFRLLSTKEVDAFLEEEARARGFKNSIDALMNMNKNPELANDATPFDQLVKERAIAIKGLRKIEADAHHAHTSPTPDSMLRDIAIALATYYNDAHNVLDEIGDDRISELE